MTDHASPVVQTVSYIVSRDIALRCWDCDAGVRHREDVLDEIEAFERMQEDAAHTALLRFNRADGRTCHVCEGSRVAAWVGITMALDK